MTIIQIKLSHDILASIVLILVPGKTVLILKHARRVWLVHCDPSPPPPPPPPGKLVKSPLSSHYKWSISFSVLYIQITVWNLDLKTLGYRTGCWGLAMPFDTEPRYSDTRLFFNYLHILYINNMINHLTIVAIVSNMISWHTIRLFAHCVAPMFQTLLNPIE